MALLAHPGDAALWRRHVLFPEAPQAPKHRAHTDFVMNGQCSAASESNGNNQDISGHKRFAALPSWQFAAAINLSWIQETAIRQR